MPSRVVGEEVDVLSFVSAARFWSPKEWAAKETDPYLTVADDPEARVVAEDVIPFLFPIKQPERLLLFALGACGVSTEPSFVCDEPMLARPEWQDFALLNGDYLPVGPEFARNLCSAAMQLNPVLFGVIGCRLGMFSDSSALESLSRARWNSNPSLFLCEQLLCSNHLPDRVRLREQLSSTSKDDPMVAATLVLSELTWPLDRSGEKASHLASLSLDWATLQFRKAVDDAAPREILFASVLLGGALAASGKARESISLFESAADLLKGDERSDSATCQGLLYEVYFKLTEAYFPAGPSRNPILGAIAAAGVARCPTSRTLMHGLRFCDNVEPLLTQLLAAPRKRCELFLTASSLLEEVGAVRVLESALIFNRNCVAFWKQYLQLNKSMAEQVLFRALRSSPWCKRFWLMLYESFCSEDEEKRDVYQLMSAKEIRLRHQLK